MGASVRIESNAIEVVGKVADEVNAWLEEAAGEIESQAKRNTPVGKVDGGGTKRDWDHKVDDDAHKAVIGNPQETAIWLEFGTGDYALEGKGRKGGWWIKVGNGTNEISPSDAAAYGWKKVRKDKDGNLTYVFTTGMKPKRILHNAVESSKSKIQKRLISRLKEIGGD